MTICGLYWPGGWIPFASRSAFSVDAQYLIILQPRDCPTNIEQASDRCEDVLTEIEEAAVVDEEFLKIVLKGILAEGHVLLEDVPGTGKTLTARSPATALDVGFNRIQFTPDLLPSDVTRSVSPSSSG